MWCGCWPPSQRWLPCCPCWRPNWPWPPPFGNIGDCWLAEWLSAACVGVCKRGLCRCCKPVVPPLLVVVAAGDGTCVEVGDGPCDCTCCGCWELCWAVCCWGSIAAQITEEAPLPPDDTELACTTTTEAAAAAKKDEANGYIFRKINLVPNQITVSWMIRYVTTQPSNNL